MSRVYYTQIETPIGPFMLAGNGETLLTTSFSTGSQRRKPEAGWIEDATSLRFAIDQLEEYFGGQRTHFDLPLAIVGTDFQKKVWRVLQTIPHGEVWSYGRVAEALGRPTASRAVGAANAANVLPIVVPCHRVIGADGTLAGFGGGLETKQWLLRFEGALPPQQEDLF